MHAFKWLNDVSTEFSTKVWVKIMRNGKVLSGNFTTPTCVVQNFTSRLNKLCDSYKQFVANECDVMVFRIEDENRRKMKCANEE